MNAFDQFLTDRTKLVAVSAVSNVLGTINPLPEIIRLAHAAGAKVLVDGAQSVPHEPVNVQTLDCDFLAFSGHKMAGPTGIGALYGKLELLEAMPAFLGGGSMIRTVTKQGFTPALLPAKFEAGTPPIVPAIGLGAAIKYLEEVGLSNIHAHEQALTRYAHELLADVPGIRFLGPAPEKKAGLVSFAIAGLHPSDIAFGLDQQGIAIRAGHHCAMPLHDLLGLPASARASFYLYNTPAEVEALAAGIRKVVELAL
jgi:cysteine desulfurase/selenocysteine lyase